MSWGYTNNQVFGYEHNLNLLIMSKQIVCFISEHHTPTSNMPLGAVTKDFSGLDVGSSNNGKKERKLHDKVMRRVMTSC